MILLGFDTATPATAVALRLDGAEAIEARDDPPPGQCPRHTSDLLALAAGLLAQAQVGWNELGAIAVGLGPGTFTGLRVGVATARALAQSLDLRVLGVPSLRALAEPALPAAAVQGPAHGLVPAQMPASAHGLVPAQMPAPAHGPVPAQRPTLAHGPARAQRPTLAQGPVLAVLDARRGEAFLAAYRRRKGVEELLAPRAIAPGQLAATLAELAAGGVQPAPALAVGDGAIRFRAQLEAAGATVPGADSPLHLLRASAICELALRETRAQDLDQVLPSYGRRPDAEIAIEAAAR